MLWLLLISWTAFAGRWDDHPSDIVAERTIEASPEELFSAVSQFRYLSRLFPEECVEDWAIGSPSVARLTYHVGPMRRRLTAKISRAEAGRFVEIDHEGDKGFVTQIRFEPRGDATLVRLATFIHPPPRPFQGIYFKKVRPEWVRCYFETLDELADRVEQPKQAPESLEPYLP